jgi:hypothetical protein
MWRFEVQGDIVSDYSRAYLLESIIRMMDAVNTLRGSSVHYIEKGDTENGAKVAGLAERLSEIIKDATEIKDNTR